MGGIVSSVRRAFHRDDFIGTTVLIHGVPYLFQRRIGVGGFGAVYQARAPNGTPVAIKVVNINGMPAASRNVVAIFLNEVSLLERLRQESHHVVMIYDFDFDTRTGLAYIVMELGGENLLQLITRLRSNAPIYRPPLSPIMIRSIWKQMVSIVGTLHANGIVHMDLKPDNLIFFGNILKIVDLGTSKKVDMPGIARLGTPFFSAPEIMQDAAGLRRFYSPRVDIWSLGAILYFIVYGRPPSYHAFASSPPPGQPPYPDVALNDILRKTLVLNPAARADIHTLIYHPYTMV